MVSRNSVQVQSFRRKLGSTWFNFHRAKHWRKSKGKVRPGFSHLPPPEARKKVQGETLLVRGKVLSYASFNTPRCKNSARSLFDHLIIEDRSEISVSEVKISSNPRWYKKHGIKIKTSTFVIKYLNVRTVRRFKRGRSSMSVKKAEKPHRKEHGWFKVKDVAGHISRTAFLVHRKNCSGRRSSDNSCIKRPTGGPKEPYIGESCIPGKTSLSSRSISMALGVYPETTNPSAAWSAVCAPEAQVLRGAVRHQVHRLKDTAASALLLKHEFLDGGADDVTLATLCEVLLEPTLTTLQNFFVRSNSQWEAASWRSTP